MFDSYILFQYTPYLIYVDSFYVGFGLLESASVFNSLTPIPQDLCFPGAFMCSSSKSYIII